MRGRWSLAIAGLILILAGGLLAHLTQTAGGIRIQDVRFKGAKGNTMSALLYIPPNATAQTPAPGILAVHGYINSRETQDGFAIEFARRGYVVLALDQTGHGYSDPPAFANGFGGPDGLAHLRSLDIVDKNNIGLEGHSMGGWTVLAAATAMPNDYKSMVLEGSSTGKPFAADGTPSWPRNVALVFAQYEEFSNADVGGRSGARRHPKPEAVGAVRHHRRRSSPARSMATSHRAPHGCSTRPRSPTRPSIFRIRRSATASTGSPRRCRAARRAQPTIRSGSARRSAR